MSYNLAAGGQESAPVNVSTSTSAPATVQTPDACNSL
jgi:hypothetical protein